MTAESPSEGRPAETERPDGAPRLFRAAALARRSATERLDEPLSVVSSRSWAVLGLLGCLCAVVLAWGLLGRLDERLDLACGLVLSGERHAVVSAADGVVEEVLAESGDSVAAGEVVARVWSAQADSRFDLTSPAAGEFTFGRLTVGQYTTAGETVAQVRSSAHDRFMVVAYASRLQVLQAESGMEARLLPIDGGDPVAAVVRDVPPRPAADLTWLASLGLPDPQGAHLIELELSEQPERHTVDGEPCRVGIVVARRTPASLLVGQS